MVLNQNMQSMGRIKNSRAPDSMAADQKKRSNRVCRYIAFVSGLTVLGVLGYFATYRYLGINVLSTTNMVDVSNTTYSSTTQRNTNVQERLKNKTYKILWYSMLAYLQKRPHAAKKDFSVCEYNNCELTFKRKEANISDAVLFDGRYLRKLPFNKSRGQIWIFAAHESPYLVGNIKNIIKEPVLKGMYNWTMTYDRNVADIHIPYGILKEQTGTTLRNFSEIANRKTDGALIITSHCNTQSKRLEYIKELKKYINVEILGRCGKKMKCGKSTIHDSCFDILNKTYAFYLAFENALCDNYHTEKVFENFKYDILIVTRGGRNRSESSLMFPRGSVIMSEDFKDAKHLGSYLKQLTQSKEEYAKLLKEKSRYYSEDYADIYQRALCDLCYQLNHQEKYHKVIPDITKVFNLERSCMNPGKIDWPVVKHRKTFRSTKQLR